MKKNLMNLIMSCAHVDIHGFPTQFIISKVQQYSLNCMEPFTATDLKKKNYKFMPFYKVYIS